ncbi:hypothetical protein LPJ61_003505, partial [Coemansia biformis]
TDDSDREEREADRNAAPSAKVRKRRRPQGSPPSAQDPAAPKDGDDHGPRAGGGYNGGSTKHIPCKFYKHGNCTAGSYCFFSHDVGLIVEKAVCKYFVKGNCRYGNKCALLHNGQNDGAAAAAGRSPKTHKAAANGAQGRRAAAAAANGDATAAAVPARGNLRNALTAGGTSKKERKAGSDPAYSDTAAGHVAPHSQESSESAGSPAPMSLARASGPQGVLGDSAGGLGSTSGPGRQLGAAWPTPSVAAALRKGQEHHSGTPPAPAGGPKERGRFAGADALDPAVAANGGGTCVTSQPIPKPASSSLGGRALRGNDEALACGGFSMHESMQIDSLSMSHGAAHHSFAGSPFLTSSIPLLDHFKDLARGDAAASMGTSPRAQPFARSPIATNTPGLLLNRHAFTAIDSAGPGSDALDGDSGSTSPRRTSHYGHLYQQRLDLSPGANSAGGAHSIPHTNELFGRPLRPSSLLNEPLSPLSSLAAAADYADGGAQAAFPIGRLRSNSHVLSPPPPLPSAGRSPGKDFGVSAATSRFYATGGSSLLADDGRLGAYSLNDVQGLLPYSRSREAPGSSAWNTYIDSGLGSEPRLSLGSGGLSYKAPGAQRATGGGGGGLASQANSLGHQPHLQAAAAAQPHWAALQASAHSSPFAAATAGSFGDHLGDHRQPMLPPHGGLRSSLGESPMLGAIGQQRTMKHPSGYPATGGLAASFGGFGTSMFGLDASRAGNGSANGSSAASDNVDDLFELEQDAPARTRASTSSAFAPNPQFISMEGFGQLFSGLSLGRTENGDTAPEHLASSGSRPLARGLSAISRPAV